MIDNVKQINDTHSDLVKSLTADFSFAISVFFFVLVGCFVDLALLFDFDALTLPPLFQRETKY
jgi:hypothetical protein